MNKYQWTKHRMPLIYHFAEQLPKTEKEILFSLPLTWETGCLVDSVKEKFRKIIVLPLTSGKNSSTQSTVFPFLRKRKIEYFELATEQNRLDALRRNPDIIVDCLFTMGRVGFQEDLIPPSTFLIEDTRTGGERLRRTLEETAFPNPFFVLDDSVFKQNYENRIGIGYSVVAALASMGIFLPTKRIIIIGFGPVGQGIAHFARKMGAQIHVVELSKSRQILAISQGFEVANLDNVISQADLIITCTGQKHILKEEHFNKLKDAVLLVNAGGDFGEWEQEYLGKHPSIPWGDYLQQYTLQNGKRIVEVAGGNTVNLVCGISISEFLDITFALAILAVKQQIEQPTSSGQIELDAKIANELQKVIDLSFYSFE